MTQDLKYLKLLSEKYPNRQSVCTEIINLAAIMNLPKGTEHFMSDIHGEYEAFLHIMNNCSGVIREKIEMIFGDRLTEEEQRELRTLIYYPRHKIRIMKAQGQGKLSPKWYRKTLREMVEIARVLSSKYTRSKVRKAMPQEFAYIIDELLHALPDEGTTSRRITSVFLTPSSGSRTAMSSSRPCRILSSALRWIISTSWETCLTEAPTRTRSSTS